MIIPRWLPDSNSVFWYRREISDGKFSFFHVDCDEGICRPAFDHAQLADKLSESGVPVERDALPFSWIHVDADCLWVRFPYKDKIWQFSHDGNLMQWKGDFHQGHFDRGCPEVASPWSRESAVVTLINYTAKSIDVKWISNEGDVRHCGVLHSGKTRIIETWLNHYWRLVPVEAAPDSSVSFQVISRRSKLFIADCALGISLSWSSDPFTEKAGDDATMTASNLWRPFLHAGNLWARGSDDAESQVTFRGFSDNEFKYLYVSPDGNYAIVNQCKAASQSSLLLVDVLPEDQFQPKLVREDFRRPGENLEVKRPCLFNLVTKKEVFVDSSLFGNPYAITNIGWSDDSQRYYFIFNQRGHQVLRLLEINLSGAVRVLAEEESKTFVDYHQKTYCKLLPDTDEFLWASERDNWNHLYLFCLTDGKLKCQITKGEWVVHSIDHVDVKKRKLWLRVLGIVPEQDPYYAHLVSVNFDGSKLRLITNGDGSHSWHWGPQHRFLIDTWSRVDCLPQSSIREAETGKELVFLHQEKLPACLEGKWTPAERFTAPGRDGKTHIYGIIIYPQDFDRTKKYPVIEFIYAGPQDFYTNKLFGPLTDFRVLADKGYIVVRSDGMGTNWRSKTFQDVSYKSLHDAGFTDRIAWMRAAAESRPYMDLSRVGCYGISSGGHSAVAAVLHHSDFYKAAMAGNGAHDDRMGSLLWSEMWMGYPVDERYEECSYMTHAHKLGGALMLAVGGMDNVVDPSSTMRLAQRLMTPTRILN